MQPIISGREGNRIRIEVTIDLSGSMLEAEESILRGVNAVGDAATAEALKRFDADGDPIAIGDAKWYSKGKLKLELCDARAGRQGDDGWYRGRWHLHADLRPEVAGSDDRKPFALRQAWRASAYDLCGSRAGVWQRDIFRSHGA